MTELTTKGPQAGYLKQMPRIIARRFLLIAIGGALLAGMTFAQSGTDTNKKDDLTGGWTITVTPPPESGAPSFRLLFTFTADGNLLATGTGGDYPALGNPCHGVWTKTGDRTFAVTYLCLDFDSTLQFTGTDKIRGALKIDKKTGELTGQLDLTHYDPNDNLIFSACCAALQGSRLQVEQLP
jgi:hypothetical protein